MTDIDPSKVKAGDTVTLVQNVEPGASATRIDGPVSAIERYREGGALHFRMGGYLVGIGAEDHQYTLTDHQPAEPEWKPGTVGTATVRGVEGVRVMRMEEVMCWLSSTLVKGHRQHGEGQVTDFVPDDAEAWQERYHEANRTVERLRAARTLPTREEVAEVMYPELPVRTTLADPTKAAWVDRVCALFEQGGAAPKVTEEADAEGCPDDCGGCACHIAPPCSHCVEHTTDDEV